MRFRVLFVWRFKIEGMLFWATYAIAMEGGDNIF
jgi:hypothetical protein